MSGSKWILVALAVLLIGAVAVLSSGGPSAGLVDSDQLTELQASGVRIVDVRTASEHAMARIPGSENIPLSSFADASKSWDPAEPIVLYCATGNRSAEAAEMLQAAGFDNVYDLAGGIAAWTGPVEDGQAGVGGIPPQSPTATPVLYEFYTDW